MDRLRLSKQLLGFGDHVSKKYGLLGSFCGPSGTPFELLGSKVCMYKTGMSSSGILYFWLHLCTHLFLSVCHSVAVSRENDKYVGLEVTFCLN